MRFDIITLFPELFAPFFVCGVTRRAYESGLVDARLWNPRDFADGNYRRVDDRPYGGGPGMVMMGEPLVRCLDAIQTDRMSSCGVRAPVVLFSPVGQTLTHLSVQTWSGSTGAVLVCGRYEGLDQRFIDRYVDHQISLGDFVLSGGEIAAMVLLDSIARLQPGVLNAEGSHQFDSFNPALDGLLDCPHYTRPEVWGDDVVPPVLTSGNHKQIQQWRRERSLQLTALQRPDLLERARTQGKLSRHDEVFLQNYPSDSTVVGKLL